MTPCPTVYRMRPADCLYSAGAMSGTVWDSPEPKGRSMKPLLRISLQFKRLPASSSTRSGISASFIFRIRAASCMELISSPSVRR